MKQFFQTDPDTRQFCRALSPTTYQFTDIVPFYSKSASPNRNYYAVAAETIDLSAYTIRQLEQAVEPYYCSLRGLVSAYGSDTTLPEILQIIAECVFENIETLSLIHISEPTRRVVISYAVFCLKKFFLMIRRPPRSTRVRSSAASDVYKRQTVHLQKLF